MAWPSFTNKEINEVKKILASGKVNYWTGGYGKKFEKYFSNKFKIKYSIAVANGSVGLEIALKAIGIGPGDQVIVPAKSYFSSASSIVNVGAKPVFCDVDLNSQNISLDYLKKKFNYKVKAVIVVHLGGVPCEIDKIVKFAKNKNLKVIEDCSQAHGAKYNGKYVGTYGDVGVWSCCNDKIISTGGEGGIVATRNRKIWLKLWSLKEIGKDYFKSRKRGYTFKFLHDSFGTNLRMTEIQSFLGYSQLKVLDRTINKRLFILNFFYSFLKNFNFIRLQKFDKKTFVSPYRAYFFLDFSKIKKKYNLKKIVKDLNKKNILINTGSCSEIYKEIAFKKYFKGKFLSLKNSKKLSKITLALNIDPNYRLTFLKQTRKKLESYFNKIKK